MKSGWKSACVANMYIDVKTMLTHFIADAAKAAGMKNTMTERAWGREMRKHGRRD